MGAGRSSKKTDSVRQRLRQVGKLGRSGSVRRKNHVTRCGKEIERSNRTDRADIVSAYRELVAKIKSVVNRHASDKRKRGRILYLRTGRKAAYRPGDQAETEDFGMLCLLPSNRDKLRVRDSRLILP